jgi:chromosome partitioning protein
VEELYDFVIVDGPPSMSVVALSALRAVSEVLIPVECAVYSVAGIGRLSAMIEDVRRYCDQDDLHILRIVLTRVPPQRKGTKNPIEEELRRRFGPLLSLIKIPQDIKVEQGLLLSRAVLEFAPGSPAAAAYQELVMEVLAHGQRSKSRRANGGEGVPVRRGRAKRRAAG